MASVKNKEGLKAGHTIDLGIEGKGTKRTRINPNGLNKKTTKIIGDRRSKGGGRREKKVGE